LPTDVWEDGRFAFVVFDIRGAENKSDGNGAVEAVAIFVVDRFLHTLIEAKTIVPNADCTMATVRSLKEPGWHKEILLPVSWAKNDA
jgi:hypothetical protein